MTNPGWSCPKCGSVYAPWVKRCEECPKASGPPHFPCNCKNRLTGPDLPCRGTETLHENFYCVEEGRP